MRDINHPLLMQCAFSLSGSFSLLLFLCAGENVFLSCVQLDLIELNFPVAAFELNYVTPTIYKRGRRIQAKKAKTGCKNSYSNSQLTFEFELIKLNWDFETILC